MATAHSRSRSRRSRLVGLLAAFTLLSSCGGPSVPSIGGDGSTVSVGSASAGADPTGRAGGGGGQTSPFAQVQVVDDAYVDADREGGDELSGVSFGATVSAVCTTGERVGVVPAEVDQAEVEDWTNATEEPVVYVDPDDVTGDIGGLSTCSMAYETDELDDTVLHGHHMHAAHS